MRRAKLGVQLLATAAGRQEAHEEDTLHRAGVPGSVTSVRIYFATGLVDMRNGVDGLRTIVEQVLKRNPNEGHLFVWTARWPLHSTTAGT
jgi:transposase